MPLPKYYRPSGSSERQALLRQFGGGHAVPEMWRDVPDGEYLLNPDVGAGVDIPQLNPENLSPSRWDIPIIDNRAVFPYARPSFEVADRIPIGTDLNLDPGFRTQGYLTIGDLTVPYGSGGSGRGSIPYGTWPVDDTYVPRTPSKGLAGWAVNNPGGYMDDPRYEGGRSDIMIHADQLSDIDRIITAGCIGIAEEYWPAFRDALQQAQKEHGRMILTVTPNGAVIYPEGQEPPNGIFVNADQFIEASRMQTEALQVFLRDQGYDPGPIDGIAGPQTAAAIQQYQTVNGLNPSGEVTPDTAKVLRSQGLGANPEQASAKKFFSEEVTGRLGERPMPEGAGKPPPPVRAQSPLMPQGAGKPPPPVRQPATAPVIPQGAGKPPPPVRQVPATARVEDPRFAGTGSEYPSNREMVRDPNWRPNLPGLGAAPPAAEALVKAALGGSYQDIEAAAGGLLFSIGMAGAGQPDQAAKDAAVAAAAGTVSDYFQRIANETPYGLMIKDRLEANPSLAEAIPDWEGSRQLIVNGLTNIPDPSIAVTPTFARAMSQYVPNTPSARPAPAAPRPVPASPARAPVGVPPQGTRPAAPPPPPPSPARAPVGVPPQGTKDSVSHAVQVQTDFDKRFNEPTVYLPAGSAKPPPPARSTPPPPPPVAKNDGFNVLSGNKTGVPANNVLAGNKTGIPANNVLAGDKTGIPAHNVLAGAEKSGLPAPKPAPIYKPPAPPPPPVAVEPILNPDWVAWNNDVSMNTELKRLGVDSQGNKAPPKYLTPPPPAVAAPKVAPAPPPPPRQVRRPAPPNPVRPAMPNTSPQSNSPFRQGQALPGTSTPAQKTGTSPGGTQYAYGTSQSGTHTYSYVDSNGKPHTYLSSGSGPDIPVSTGSGGGGTSSKVICTHMMRRGYLDRELWKEDMRYALDLPRVVREGYLAWATPLAARMAAGDRRLEAYWRPLADRWARYAAWRRGRVDLVPRLPVTGLGVHVVLGGFSLLVGVFRRIRDVLVVENEERPNASHS